MIGGRDAVGRKVMEQWRPILCGDIVDGDHMNSPSLGQERENRRQCVHGFRGFIPADDDGLADLAGAFAGASSTGRPECIRVSSIVSLCGRATTRSERPSTARSKSARGARPGWARIPFRRAMCRPLGRPF